MRVRVHEPDLAPEERRALGALEETLRAAVIRQRAVETAHTIRARQMRVDQAQVLANLLRGEQVLEYRVDLRKRAVAHAGRLITRVQEVARAGVGVEQRVAGEHAV